MTNISRREKQREKQNNKGYLYLYKAKFTFLFEGETSNREELNYKIIIKTKLSHDFYSYLYYFYLLEEDISRSRNFY